MRPTRIILGVLIGCLVFAAVTLALLPSEQYGTRNVRGKPVPVYVGADAEGLPIFGLGRHPGGPEVGTIAFRADTWQETRLIFADSRVDGVMVMWSVADQAVLDSWTVDDWWNRFATWIERSGIAPADLRTWYHPERPEYRRQVLLGLLGNFLVLFAGYLAVCGLAYLFWVAHTWRCRRRGRCAQCGYLLHGLQSSRCPECGHEYTPARTAP